MVVLSGSLSGETEDHIEVGDLVFVGRADPEKLEVGDVIAYMNGGTTVTHRITAIDTDADGGLLFTIKGDANNAPDLGPVRLENVVGKVVGQIPGAGRVLGCLRTPLGLMCLVLLGILLLAWYVRPQRSRVGKEDGNGW